MPVTPVNTRLYWGVTGVGIASQAAPTTFKHVRGCQTAGVSGRLPITYIYEMGIARTYDAFEELPEVEVQLEKVLDGHAPIWTMATEGAASADLLGRSNKHCVLAMSLHRDNQARASGNQVAEMVVQKAFATSLQWDFQINGPFRETVGMVSDNMLWRTTGFVFTGHTSAHGVSSLDPQAPEGVNRRQHLVMADCLFPAEIPGIDGSNENPELTIDGNTQYAVSFEQIRVSANLNREAQLELGRKGVYTRYIRVPVEVTTTYDFKSKTGIAFTFSNTTENSSDQPIYLKTTEGTILDLGATNRLTSVNQSNGSAGQQGDQTLSFVYANNSSELTVQHPLDPTVALRP